MDYHNLYKEPEPQIPQEVASERGLIFSLIDKQDASEAENDLIKNGANSESQQRAEQGVNDKKEPLVNQAKAEIISDPELTEDEKLTAISLNSYEPIDYVSEMADRFRLDVKGLSNREKTQKLNRYLLEHDTNVNEQIYRIKKYRALKDASLTSQMATEIMKHGRAQLFREGLLDASFDVAGEMIPLNTQRMYNGLYEHMMGEYPEGAKIFLSGNVQEELKTVIKNTPLDKRYAFMRKMADYVIENSGMFTESNDVMASHILNGVLEDAISGEEHDLDENINNFVSIMDSLTVGIPMFSGALQTIKVATKIGVSTGSAILKAMFGGNSSMVKDVAAGIKSGQIELESIGTSQPLMDMAITSSELEHMPEEFVEMLVNAKSATEEIEDTMSHNMLVPGTISEAETGMLKIIDETYKSITKSGTTFKADDVTGDIGVTFIANRGKKGYQTQKEAIEDANQFSDDFEILIKTEDNLLVPVKEVPDNVQGEYFIRFNETVSIPDALSVAKRTINSDDIRFKSLYPFAHRWFLDSTNGLSQRLAYSIDAALDMTEGAAHQLRDIVKPYQSLNTKDQSMVVQTINTFIKEKKPITWKNINSLPVTEKVKSGLWSYNLAVEANYKLFNSILRRTEVKKGTKHIQMQWKNEANKTVQFNLYGKRIEKDSIKYLDNGITEGNVHVPKNTIPYYEHSSGKIRYLSKEDIDELYKNGSYLIKSNEHYGDGNFVSRVVIGGKGTKFADLPENMMNYKNAHNGSRIYNNALYVREKKSIVKDGKREEFYIARNGYDDWASAEKARQKFIKEAEEALEEGEILAADKYKVTYARDLTSVDSRKLDNQVLMSKGRLGFSKRQDDILRGNGIDSLATIEDPITALARTMTHVADKGVRGNVIEHYESLWLSSYRSVMKDPKKGYPETRAEIKTLIEKGSVSNEATILYDKIQLIKDLFHAKEDEAIKGFLLDTAAKFAKHGDSGYIGNQVSKGLIKAATVSPITLAKSLPYTMYIAANPLRQVMLQSQQATFVATQTPGYVPQLIGDTTRLSMAMYALRFTDSVKHYKDKEFLELARQFMKSGIPGSVQHSGLAAESTIREAKGLTKHKKRDYLNPVTVVSKGLDLSKLGFVAGELGHLTPAWLVARRKFYNSTGKMPKTRKDWQTVNAEARQLGLSMTPTSGLYYSKGITGLFTQFWSIQHKALMAMATNPAYKSHRGLLVAEQAALFGLKSVPALGTLLERELNKAEMPEKLRTFIRGGLYNAIIKEVTGQYWDVSGSFAPAGGLGQSTLNLYEAFAGDMGKHLTSAMPAAAASAKVYRFVTEIVPALAGMAYEGRPLDDTATDYLNNFARLSSGWSNYTQARASFAAGELYTKSGIRTGIEFTSAWDPLMKTMGFSHMTEEAAREASEKAGLMNFYSDKDLRTDTMNYARAFKEIVINNSKDIENIDDVWGVVTKLKNEAQYLESWFRNSNPDYSDTVIKNALKMAYKNEPVIYKTLERLRTSLDNGDYGSGVAYIKNWTKHNIKDLKPEYQGMVETWFGD